MFDLWHAPWPHWPFTAFCAALTFFHVSEFFLAWLFMRKELAWSCECAYIYCMQINWNDRCVHAAWLFSKPYCLGA